MSDGDGELPELPDVPALRVLAPPPGGLARVRASIDREQEREPRQRWWLAVAPLAVAAVLLILMTGRAPPRYVATAPVPAAAEVPVADPSVGAQFYWVGSQPARAEPRPAAAVPAIDSIGSPPVTLVP